MTALDTAHAPTTTASRPAPEWAPHRAVWTAIPWDPAEWGAPLEGAQAVALELVEALLASGEAVELLDRTGLAAARFGDRRTSARPSPGQVRINAIPYGDIWLRDTGPFFLSDGSALTAITCNWNGWGGKYDMPGDDLVGVRVAALARVPSAHRALVMEGGSVDFDGAGRVLTTRECLLNPNRNAGWDESAAEAALREMFGAEEVIWLGDGLLNDHTDGHVDNVARFVAPGKAVAMAAATPDDPHHERLEALGRALVEALGPDGVTFIPAPGLVPHPETGAPQPASYLNFLIANEAVIVPVYGTAQDEPACAALGALFPGRRVIAIRADALLTGGGSIHCMTKEEPAR